MPFLIKSSILTGAVRAGEFGDQDEEWNYRDGLAMGIGLLSYGLLYPLEVMNLRMSIEV